MKTLIFDVMLHDRFVCTLCYKYCPLFPIEERELHDFAVSKRPTLRIGNALFVHWIIAHDILNAFQM